MVRQDECVACPAEAARYRYGQLAFFEIPHLPLTGGPDRPLEPSSLVECDVFPRNQYGEVKGELHYDAESGHLVALTDGNGAFVVSLDGDVMTHLPDLSLARPPSHGDSGSRYSGPDGWSYAPQHRVFYRWIDGAGIEERAVHTARQPT